MPFFRSPIQLSTQLKASIQSKPIDVAIFEKRLKVGPTQTVVGIRAPCNGLHFLSTKPIDQKISLSLSLRGTHMAFVLKKKAWKWLRLCQPLTTKILVKALAFWIRWYVVKVFGSLSYRKVLPPQHLNVSVLKLDGSSFGNPMCFLSVLLSLFFVSYCGFDSDFGLRRC